MRIITKPIRARVLDFDIENRPLSYWVPDRPSAEITAIASCWADDPDSMECWLLGRDDPKEMLKRFLERYNEAGMVTGHYIRRHDLPIINGALIEYRLPYLQPKIVQDTKIDLIRESDLPVSQENLAHMMGVYRKKKHMTQADWREANRLTPEGLVKTEERVTSDVKQNMDMRKQLLKYDLLKSPRIWKSK